MLTKRKCASFGLPASCGVPCRVKMNWDGSIKGGSISYHRKVFYVQVFLRFVRFAGADVPLRPLEIKCEDVFGNVNVCLSLRR